MKKRSGIPTASALIGVAMVMAAVTGTGRAEVWHSIAGAQSANMGKQAIAFLTNELWIHAGDSVEWSFPTTELHTLTFLIPGQVRPPFPVGCPGTAPDGSSYDGSACVNSGVLQNGPSYTVTFPNAGNFKFVCLVHSRMTGMVHVLAPGSLLPHDQGFYDRQSNRQASELLSEAAGLEGQANAEGQQSSVNGVTAGMSALLGTGGGSQAAAVMRFLGGNTVVHVGDTVEWTNPSLMVVHTVTFGAEPANLVPPSPAVPFDADGVPHATISSPNQSVHSGFISQQNQEIIGSPQLPVDITRFRVTFTAPGIYNYFCALHDILGMVAKVTVLP